MNVPSRATTGYTADGQSVTAGHGLLEDDPMVEVTSNIGVLH